MRLHQYLNEDIIKERIELIEKNCQPFLKDLKKLNNKNLLYSGRPVTINFTKKKVRKNRKPKNTPEKLHNLMDDWFYGKFGVRSRSNAIFCIFEYREADLYGEPHVIFPIGKYKAVSSPIVLDLYAFFEDSFFNLVYDVKKNSHFKPGDEELLIDELEQLEYTDKLIYHFNEIMITCKEYYILHLKSNKELIEYFEENY